MHGESIDWVMINTVKKALSYPSGEEHNGKEIKDYLQYKFDKELDIQPIFKRVLDLGSLDVNGTIRNYKFLRENYPLWRDLINCKEYVGIDLIEGPSVDRVMSSGDLKFEDNSFDLILSLSALEHDIDPQKTIKEAFRVLKPGGIFLIVCPNKDVPPHTDLGGGSKEVYNIITLKMLKEWIVDSGFTINSLIPTYCDYLVNATKK